ncbi:hypothetical protein TNCV_3588571 [Trichonephila clavipes]|nr:hypothetical protein TNCV_3588571 [Trichonephila clavipes]
MHGISSFWFSECQEIQNFNNSNKGHTHHLLGCKWWALHEISDLRIDCEFRQVLCNITITEATHPQNETGKKLLSFASRQCKTALQCTNTGRHGKTEIQSSSTTFLLSRFGTVGLLVVPKIEGDVEKSTFFNGCRSSDSHVQMNTKRN